MKYPPDNPYADAALRYGSDRDIELTRQSEEIVTAGQDNLVKFFYVVVGIVVLAFLLCGCGENWDSYDRPENGNETEWHKCMREHDPVHRHVCRDLR